MWRCAPRAAARWRHMRSEAALKVRELTNSGEFGCFTYSIVIKRCAIFHIGAYLWFMRSISVWSHTPSPHAAEVRSMWWWYTSDVVFLNRDHVPPFMYEMFNRLGLHFIHLVSLIRFALSIKCTAWLSKREYFVLWTMHAMRMVSRFFGSVIGRLHSKDYQCSLAITWNLRIFSWDRSTLSRGSKSLIVPLAFNENSIIVVLM
jgi:hypothetical protein